MAIPSPYLPCSRSTRALRCGRLALLLLRFSTIASISLPIEGVFSLGAIDGVRRRFGGHAAALGLHRCGPGNRETIIVAGAADADASSLMATTAVASASSSKRVSGIRDLARGGGEDEYDTFLLDMWGVMHDGSQPYEGVLNTVKKLKGAGKSLVILSNSSKRKEVSIKMLRKLGFDPDDFERIITSGDVAHDMLSNNVDSLGCSDWDVLTDLLVGGDDEKTATTKKAFVFGSGDLDEEYIQSAGWELAPMSEADLIVARGTFTIDDGNGIAVSKKTDGEEEYFRVLGNMLSIAASRKVPMLVTNPDKVRPDAGLPPMPGAIGDAYEATLTAGIVDAVEARSLVKRVGKPFREVYDIALGGKDRRRAVMVGDALETDVTGGANAKCATLWVVGDGVHSDAVSESGGRAGIFDEKTAFEYGARSVIKYFNGKEGTYAYGRTVIPEYVTTHFRW